MLTIRNKCFYYKTSRLQLFLDYYVRTLTDSIDNVDLFVVDDTRERYRKPTWIKGIPESCKLTDAQVTRFVEGMKSTVFLSMFSKYGSQDSAVALRHLSTMRPELIVPTLLEK